MGLERKGPSPRDNLLRCCGSFVILRTALFAGRRTCAICLGTGAVGRVHRSFGAKDAPQDDKDSGRCKAILLEARRFCCRLRFFFRVDVVADVGTLHPEDDVFSDIGRVVGDALQIACDKQRIECLTHNIRALIHRLDELDEGIIAHAVDDVVHFKHGLG